MVCEQKDNSKKKWLAGCFIVLISLALSGVTTGGRQEDDEKGLLGNKIEELLSKDSRVRDRTVDSILQDRLGIVKQLIPLIEPANAQEYSDETRCAAAYLLGEFRAIKAVPVLSRALADEPGRKLISDTSRYDVPVWTALVKIGRPAVPAMIENVKNSDNKILRKKSLDVLIHALGGKRRITELLTKLKAQTKDPSKIQHINAAIQHTQEHFEEDKEPLY